MYIYIILIDFLIVIKMLLCAYYEYCIIFIILLYYIYYIYKYNT